MVGKPDLNEIVLFELPTYDSAERLRNHLAKMRLAWLESRRDPDVLVGTLLSPNDGDLATLLRQVESWALRHDVGAIRFELDGRMYALRGPRSPAGTGLTSAS